MPDLKKLITLEALQAALPSWLKSSTKPSYTADEINDTNTTNKFVTSTEKSTWNSKQSALTTTQMSAVNSGITSERVTQISTNQTNILYVSNQIGKNVLDARSYVASGQATGITVTVNDDCSVTLNGTSSSSNNIIYGYFDADVKPNTRYAMKGTGNSNVKIQLIGYNDINNPTVIFNDVNDNVGSSGNWQHYQVRLWIAAKPSSGTQFSNVIIYPMLCPEELWNISHEVTPYALPNKELTRLETEDRAALAEDIDAGAKNKCRLDRTYIVNNNSGGIWSGDSYTVSGVTFAFNFTNGTIACSGTASAAIFLVLNNDIANYTGKEMAISGCPSGGNYDTGYSLYVVDTSETTILKDIGSGATFTVPSNVKRLKIGVRSGTNMASKTFYPMICTKAAWKVSQKIVPYQYPSPKIVATLTKSITSSTALDFTGLEYAIKANTHYRITAFAKFSSNPLEIAICNAQNSAVFGYAANQDPSGTTMAMLSVVSYVLSGAAIPIAIKAKYKSASTSTVGMIIEEL